MFKRKKLKQIGALLDGETRYSGNATACLDDVECRAHGAAIEAIRRGAREAAHAPEISDGQFGAFMAGIREGVEQPEARPASLWAMASLSAAALVLVLSLLAIFSRGAEPVRATEIESVHTELEGVTVEFNNQQDVSTVWVTMTESDLW